MKTLNRTTKHEKAQAEQIARLTRFIDRISWKCCSCGEHYPLDRKSFFGACPDCFTGNEDLNECIDADRISDNDVAAFGMPLYLAIMGMRAGYSPAAARLNYRHPTSNGTVFEAEMWNAAECLFGERFFRLSSKRSIRPINPSSLRWKQGIGLVPISLASDDYPGSGGEWRQFWEKKEVQP